MNGSQVMAASEASIKPASLSERLEHEEKTLSARLEKVKVLRSVLKNNAELQGVLDALTELGHYNY